MTVLARDIVPGKEGGEAAALASKLVRIKSYSGDEAEIASFLAQHMAGLGLEVSVQQIAPLRFNAIGRWRGSGGKPSLMYNGHMDTNPAGEGWVRDPLGGQIEDGFVYGIGVCNMKAANASFLHAVESLQRQGFVPQGDLVLAFVVGELQGGVGTVRMLESGVRADYFIVGEPTELTLLTRHSASFVFEITVLGSTRHLSKREEGVDAIAQAEKLLGRLRPFTFTGADCAEDRGLNRINIGVIKGGMSRALHDWRPQQLADVCVLKCAGRFGPSQTLNGAMRDIQQVLDELGTDDETFRAELRLVEDNRIFMPPFKVAHDTPPVQAVADAHRAITGSEPLIGMHTPAKFFGSDAAHLAAAGMVGLLYGPGGRYNTMPDERVAIDEINAACEVYAKAVRKLIGPTA
ncbi:MAG: acetylornithine deacetylase [Variibacter sp.]|jgi:acetylornithine deacetylase|nr:acetylornithine deacetylase [Variibacter sp.]